MSNAATRKRSHPLCVVEVQHESDFNLNGEWYEIDRGRDPEWPIFRLEDVSIGYGGRPVRLRLA